MIHLRRCGFGVLLLATGLAVGCNREDSSTGGSGTTNTALPDQSAPAAAAERAPGAPVPRAYTAARISAPQSGDMSAILNQLSLELRKYVVSTRSVPKSFEEFAAQSRVQVPPAPTGQKYVIQGQAVVLVKR